MVGVARWLRRAERYEDALLLFRRAVDKGLRDDLLFRTLWDIAALEKKLGREEAAVSLYSELAACRNAFRLPSLEELAKYYEHREKNYTMALECTMNALEFEHTESLQRRRERLERRTLRASSMRRLL
jgi:tetratricopeptide (TPR) repeat protein